MAKKPVEATEKYVSNVELKELLYERIQLAPADILLAIAKLLEVEAALVHANAILVRGSGRPVFLVQAKLTPPSWVKTLKSTVERDEEEECEEEEYEEEEYEEDEI